MAILTISKNYSNILVAELFLHYFCSFYSCFCCIIHLLFTILITKFSCKWQKTITFNIFSKSVIVKVAAVPALDNIRFSYHFNESSTLRLINGNSNDLQKLLKYFSGRAIFTLFLQLLFLFLLHYPFTFYHTYHQIFLQMTKNHYL